MYVTFKSVTLQRFLRGGETTAGDEQYSSLAIHKIDTCKWSKYTYGKEHN